MDLVDYVQNLGLSDLPLPVRIFAYAKGNSFSRIDRMPVELHWCSRFPNLKLKVCPRSVSDHSPLGLKLAKSI